jgi:hypothetical protein
VEGTPTRLRETVHSDIDQLARLIGSAAADRSVTSVTTPALGIAGGIADIEIALLTGGYGMSRVHIPI